MEVLKKARSAEILRKLLFETLFSATSNSSFLPPFFRNFSFLLSHCFHVPASNLLSPCSQPLSPLFLFAPELTTPTSEVCITKYLHRVLVIVLHSWYNVARSAENFILRVLRFALEMNSDMI